MRWWIVSDPLRLLQPSDTRDPFSGADVQIQRLNGSNWVTVSSTTTDANGSFTAAVDLTPGSYRARVTIGRGFVAGISQTLVVVA